jgi:hypothetical protein
VSWLQASSGFYAAGDLSSCFADRCRIYGCFCDSDASRCREDDRGNTKPDLAQAMVLGIG